MRMTMSDLRSRLATPTHKDGFPVMAGHLPVLGHAVVLYGSAVEALQRAAREQGPLVWIDRGFGQWILFCFGDDTFELLRHKALAVKGARGPLDYLLGRSLVTLDGAPHRSVRTVMNPSFSPRGLGESGAERVVTDTVQRHVRAFVESGGGDVHDRAQEMAVDVIFRIVGVLPEALPEFRARYRRVLWGLFPPPVDWPGTPRYFGLQSTAWLNEQLASLVRKAREEIGDTLLHTLVRARDEEGQALSEQELVDNLRILLIAGHETTATTMTWATLRLAQRPDLVRRLQDEVSAAQLSGPVTLAQSRKLPLCEGVFREASRLHSPVWLIERRAREDFTYHGRTVPAGVRLAVSPLLWARDPAVYPDPESFHPDRWLGRPSAPTPFEIAAFGGGAHFCLGYHLSWLESVTYIALLAKELSATGKRLRDAGSRESKVVYFPLARPSPPARVAVERA